MTTITPLQELDDQRRAELASEVVSRVVDQTLAVLEDIKHLKLIVQAFSIRHGRAVDAAVSGLLDVLDALVPDLEAVNSRPATWDRHK
ncbi:hypothetical protein [Paramicrobacterium agarici]|uniref:hypothetical protein n=1 Tax=Paramicrobacterium agarici TaxID=630514 RepID=UPI00114D67C2|nr:hypothetical protein [Microbacterium agarici]TQO21471.1 hypothetical protein FB385_0273 [Microbacterium agarici]